MLSVSCRQVSATLILVCLSGFLSGCVSKANLTSNDLSVGSNCINDSAHCLAKRRTALAEIIADTKDKWIEQPVSADADASGVRLFAYKVKKKKLTCDQLHRGYAEATSVRGRLKAANNPQLTPALISRSAMLADEVASELKREVKRRPCRQGVK